MFRVKIRYVLLLFAVFSIALTGCKNNKDEPSQYVAVASSYLHSIVTELCGDRQQVFDLVPPGMCPGHFDMSPEQLRRLRGSRAMFRFDFQAGLDDKLKRVGMPMIPIQTQSGMCVPQEYIATCRQMLPFLVEHGCIDETSAQQHLRQLEIKLDALAAELKADIEKSGLTGANVIVSGHQADFAQWLGLKVVSIFKSADSMTPADIETCLRAGRDEDVAIVIANLQEGTELPDRIARRLNAALVVFSNFPDTQTMPNEAFERLLRSNVNNLVQQVRPER